MTYKVSLAVWGYHGQGGDAVPPCMGTEDFLAGGRADVTQGSPALVCRMYLSCLQYLERSHLVKRCVGTRACPESPGAAGSRPHPCLHVAKQLQAGKRAVRLASFVQALARTSLGSLNALISPQFTLAVSQGKYTRYCLYQHFVLCITLGNINRHTTAHFEQGVSKQKVDRLCSLVNSL